MPHFWWILLTAACKLIDRGTYTRKGGWLLMGCIFRKPVTGRGAWKRLFAVWALVGVKTVDCVVTECRELRFTRLFDLYQLFMISWGSVDKFILRGFSLEDWETSVSPFNSREKPWELVWWAGVSLWAKERKLPKLIPVVNGMTQLLVYLILPGCTGGRASISLLSFRF